MRRARCSSSPSLGARLFQAIVLVSTLLCIASIVGWGLSYYRGGFLVQGSNVEGSNKWILALAGSRGSSMFAFSRFSNVAKPRSGWVCVWYHDPPPWAANGSWQLKQLSDSSGGYRALYAAAPLWALSLATGLLPGLVITRRVIRRRRERSGGVGGVPCRSCGYDLRGHGHSQPAAGRCPECGAELKQNAETRKAKMT